MSRCPSHGLRSLRDEQDGYHRHEERIKEDCPDRRASRVRSGHGEWPSAVALCAALWCCFALPLRAEIIDRILAVVNGAVITLSDVTAAGRFDIARPVEGVADPVRAQLEALIERQLQLAEVNRYLPPEPGSAAIDARLNEIRSAFPDLQAFETALTHSGLTLEQLRRAIRDNLRIISYRQQRFGAAMQPAEEDIVRYYRAHPSEFTRDGIVRPYSDVRSEARERLIAERTGTLVREWIEGLRRRADITILPPIARTAGKGSRDSGRPAIWAQTRGSGAG